jgi:hypothetical protein
VGRGHGATASRDPLLPWDDVAVDLIGPRTLAVGMQKLKFSALTIMEMVANLVEMARITNKTAAHVAMQFDLHDWHDIPDPNTSFTTREESSLDRSSKKD